MPVKADVFTLQLPDRAQPLLTTVLDPSNYVVSSPSSFDSVARLRITMNGGTYGCSGSLIAGGNFILTAAHCLTEADAAAPGVTSLRATFPDGAEYTGTNYYVPPGWTGDFNDGADIGLVRLSATVPRPSYELWRAADPFGQDVKVAGYGLTGTGATGRVPGTFGTLRAGRNTLEPVLWTLPGNPFAWDFDDGSPLHDALCLVAGLCQTGLGNDEVMIASGDSGGPMFVNGYLVGVASFGATFGPAGGDIDGILNASFGELAGSTRVSEYSAWIDVTTVPEPASITMLAAVVLLLRPMLRRGT